MLLLLLLLSCDKKSSAKPEVIKGEHITMLPWHFCLCHLNLAMRTAAPQEHVSVLLDMKRLASMLSISLVCTDSEFKHTGHSPVEPQSEQ